jgi:hypothetical protein
MGSWGCYIPPSASLAYSERYFVPVERFVQLAEEEHGHLIEGQVDVVVHQESVITLDTEELPQFQCGTSHPREFINQPRNVGFTHEQGTIGRPVGGCTTTHKLLGRTEPHPRCKACRQQMVIEGKSAFLANDNSLP